MPFQVSPGVQVLENDYSNIIPGVATSAGAIAGSFVWGPVDQVVTISDENGLVSVFGPPDEDTYKTFLTATDFLSYSRHLETVRVVGKDARNAVSGGTGSGLTVDVTTVNGDVSSVTINAPGSGYRLGDLIIVEGGISPATYKVTNVNETGEVTELDVVTVGEGYATGTAVETYVQPPVLIKNLEAFENAGTLPEVLAKYPGSRGNSLALSTVTASQFEGWDFANRFVVAPAADVKVFAADGMTQSFAYGGPIPNDTVVTVNGTVIEKGTDPGRWTDNSNSIDITTDSEIFTPTVPTNEFVLNNDFEISTEGYKVEVGGVLQTLYSGEGDVPVGQFRLVGNNLKYGVNTAVFNGNSITKTFTLTGVTGIISGSPIGANSRVTVDGSVKTAVSSAPANDTQVQIQETGGNTTFTFFSAPGIGKANIRVEWDFIKTGITVTYGYPKAGPDSVKAFSNETEIHAVVFDTTGEWTGEAGSMMEKFEFLSTIPGSTSFDGTASYYVDAINRRSQYVRIGQPFFAHGTKPLAGGISDNKFGPASGVTPGIYQEGLKLFQNAEQLEIYHLIIQDQTPSSVLFAIQNVSELRRDCVTYFSPPMDAVVNNKNREADDCIAFRNLIGSSSYYHMDSNWSYKYDSYNDKFRWIPDAGASAGCYAQTHTMFDAWISGAGLNRGRIKNAVKLAWNPDKTARNKLYKNNINPITTFLGEGPVLYGDKTGQSKASAFDRMNVRFLFIVLEKAIANAARYYLFEQNDEFTRNRFKNMVVPFLRTVQGRRGIDEYEIRCDGRNNTGDVVSRNEFIADIFVRPIYSINYITLNFNAVSGNVTFNEIISQV